MLEEEAAVQAMTLLGAALDPERQAIWPIQNPDGRAGVSGRLRRLYEDEASHVLKTANESHPETHIVLKAPPNSGTVYHNNKGFYSIILLALVDADYKFLWVDVRANGSTSDCAVYN